MASDWLHDGWPNIWLPYTQMHMAELPHAVVGAEGVQLHLANGKTLIDGIASWWCLCHGYQHPALVKALTEQANSLSHVMFAGLAHQPAYTLAKNLASFIPAGLERVFFSDSGSTAVEVAMKMAVQYWHNNAQPKKYKFLSFRNGYHGDTMGAMSLTEKDKGFHQVFANYAPEQYVWDVPSSELGFAELESLLADEAKNIAAMVIEPLVQCAGGFHFHSPDILAELHKLAKAHDILFIADEIATGFYRTGYRFACEEAGITPDIMCLGKALTGGMLSMGATCTTHEVYDAFLSDELGHALMHGPTFMANPLACAAANASLELFVKNNYKTKVASIENQLYEQIKCVNRIKNVKATRVKGAIAVIEFKEIDWPALFEMRQKLVQKGVWLRPFGNTLYIMPPLIISEDELASLITAAKDVLTKG